MVLGAFDLETRAAQSVSGAVRAGNAALGGGESTRRALAGSAGDVATCKQRGLEAGLSCQAILGLSLSALRSVGKVFVASRGSEGAASLPMPELAVIPALGNLQALAPAPRQRRALDQVDVGLLELLERARKLDGDASATSRAKADAWNALARHPSDGSYRAVAERRRDDWLRIADAQEKTLARVLQRCPAYEADKKKLARLLILDDALISAAEKARREHAFDAEYGPWKTELDKCGSSKHEAVDGMVAIPGGAFVMGSDESPLPYLNYADPQDTGPAHTVAVAGFAMDVTEVTVAAYRRCVAAKGCSVPLAASASACTWGAGKGKDDLPINCVDRDQARAFCRWAGKRLPTEEEWEYAARPYSGPEPWPWGAASKTGSELPQRACWDHDRRGPCAVGSKPEGASPFGLLDMAGNVWEWTDSSYSADYASPLVSDRAVVRGGAFSSPLPEMLKATYRGSIDPHRRVGWVGFRCARSPDPSLQL
jgi:formylglycine-generating enzyme required for sulfatase activity